MSKHIFTADFAKQLLAGLNSDSAWQRVDAGSEYHKTYNHIVCFAQGVVDNCPKGSGNLLACATYGWMPTIMRDFDLTKSGLSQPIRSIREVKSSDGAVSLIKKMGHKGIIKNSWIGASKFMHFLNPSIFPIWDTRVAEKFSEHCIKHAVRQGVGQRIQYVPSAYSFANKKENYLNYTYFMLQNLKNQYEWLEKISFRFFKEKGYRPSDLRLLELMLFHR